MRVAVAAAVCLAMTGCGGGGSSSESCAKAPSDVGCSNFDSGYALPSTVEAQLTDYLAEPEPWTWFRRAVRVRKEREFDPVISGLNEAAAQAGTVAESSGDTDLRGEAERLAYLLQFVRLFFGGIETFLQIEPEALKAFLKLS